MEVLVCSLNFSVEAAIAHSLRKPFFKSPIDTSGTIQLTNIPIFMMAHPLWNA
jgi:hypothetical protein